MRKVYNVNVELTIDCEADSSSAAEKNVLRKLQELFEGSDFDQLVEVDIINVN